MKSFYKIIIMAAALVAVTFGAYAQSGVSLPFIGQGNSSADPEVPAAKSGYLQIYAQTTNSYAATNLIFVKGFSSGYAGQFYTNPFTGTAYNGGTNGFVIPNFVTNSTGIADVDLWANRDGTALNGNVNVDINGINAAFTNILTFNFATINGGGLPVTTGTGLVSFSVTGNGTNDVVVQTNLFTSTTLQGARRLRLLSVASTNAGTNGQVVNLWLNGFKPAGQ